MIANLLICSPCKARFRVMFLSGGGQLSEKVVAQPSAVSFQPSEIRRKARSPRLVVLSTKSRPSKLHFILPTPRGHEDMKARDPSSQRSYFRYPL